MGNNIKLPPSEISNKKINPYFPKVGLMAKIQLLVNYGGFVLYIHIAGIEYQKTLNLTCISTILLFLLSVTNNKLRVTHNAYI